MASELSPGVLMGLGNPLLDISAEVDDKLLEKYGLKLNNAILCEDKHDPIYKDLVDNHEVTYIAGGSTQNTIRVAQWMLDTKVKATSYVGCIGDDEFGKQLQKCAEGDNVTCHYLVDKKTPTGTCAVLIKDAERSLVAKLAAANEYKFDHVKTEELSKAVKTAQFFYIAGFFATVSPDTIMHIAEHAHEAKKVFGMNLSAEFICQFFGGVLDKAFEYCDYIFGNETEAKKWGEVKKLKDCSVEEVAKALSLLPKKGGKPRVAIITQGAEPTVVAIEGKVTKFPVKALKKEDIVDVNGAGDAFVGGFMSQLVGGSELKDCVNAGHYASSVVLKVSGTVLSGKANFAAY